MAATSSISELNTRSLKRTYEFFSGDSSSEGSLGLLAPPAKKHRSSEPQDSSTAPEVTPSSIKLSSRILSSYAHVKDLPPPGGNRRKETGVAYLARVGSRSSAEVQVSDADEQQFNPEIEQVVNRLADQKAPASSDSQGALIKVPAASSNSQSALARIGVSKGATRAAWEDEKPVWHAPWEIMTVIPGHLGWVGTVTVDPTNTWFATGAADRTIKIWDLAKRHLKLTLTGHVAGVRALVASERHPYLFSAGEDKQIFCWDLESNKAIRHYFGHMSGVYTLALHPELDLIVSGGRDRTVNVWDMRTKTAVHSWKEHTAPIFSVVAQASEPQIISGSADSTIKCWDLVAGKNLSTLTNHSKSIRDVVLHPTENSMASAGADNIKRWKLPEGNFMHNYEGQSGIVNALAINHEGVIVAGSDNGTLSFWDWRTSHRFYETQTIAQSGSVASEAGIFDASFDRTGSRLITCEADKTVKIWREIPEATPTTHPLNWKPRKQKVQW